MMSRKGKESTRKRALQESLVLRPELQDTDLFAKQVREVITDSNLLSPAETEKLLENAAVMERLRKVSNLAYKTLYELGQDFADAENTSYATKALQKWEEGVFDFYALAAPATDITKVPAILQAEKHAKLQSLSRGDMVWTSQESHFEVSKEDLETKEDPKILALKEDIQRWFGPAGLLLHTAVASWAIETTVENLQQFVSSEIPEDNRNQWHTHLLAMSAKRARIWLNLHDLGRLITHDSHLHAVLSHVVCEVIGLPRKLFQDYDFPSILEFGSEKPLIPQFTEPKKESDEDQIEYEDRVDQARVDYVNSALDVIVKKSQDDNQYENPMAVLIFWLVDAYTKLYDIRSARSLASHTGQLDNRDIIDNFAHFANLQPGDERALFLGRFFYRLKQSCGKDLSSLSHEEVEEYLTKRIESATTEEETIMYQGELKNFLYYSRQYEFARSIFVWLEKELGIPNKLLWHLIFSFTERNDKYLDRNGDFTHHPANAHTDIWKLATAENLKQKSTQSKAQISTAAQRNAVLLGKIQKLRQKSS